MTTVREFLLLQAAERAAKRTPEDRRLQILGSLSLGRQRAQAADTLWSNGHTAEGLRLAGESFGAMLEALDVSLDAEDESIAGPLRRAGLEAAAVDHAVATARTLEETVLPRLDDDVTAPHGELFHRLVQARRSLEELLGPAAMTPGQVRGTRALRLGSLVAALGLLAAIAYVLLATPPGVHATASGTWSPQQGLAEFAVDDDPGSEWQLPDRETGWLDISISPPQRIDTLRLLNGHNGGYNDRAVRSAIIEIHSRGVVARRLTQDWPTIVARPEWVEQPVGVDDVERVRIFVRGFHREGAALAEVGWD